MEKFTTFCINSAYEIAKILLATGCIEEAEFKETVHNLMSGTLNIEVLHGQRKKSSKKSKEASKKSQVA